MSRRAAPKANSIAVRSTEVFRISRRAAPKASAAAVPTLSVVEPHTDNVSQRARAYQGFTQQILSGGIRSGQFISQRELMTLLDMPLGAVREMIPRLEAGGLIKTVPQRGLQIACRLEANTQRVSGTRHDRDRGDSALCACCQ